MILTNDLIKLLPSFMINFQFLLSRLASYLPLNYGVWFLIHSIKFTAFCFYMPSIHYQTYAFLVQTYDAVLRSRLFQEFHYLRN